MTKAHPQRAASSNGMVLSALLDARVVDVNLVRTLRVHFEGIGDVAGLLLLGAFPSPDGPRGSHASLHINLKAQSAATLRAILAARQCCEAELGLTLNVSCHTLGDANPALARSGLFAAPAGGAFFVLRAKYSGVLISGRNVFAQFADPPPSRLRAEIIGTIGSFAHRLREILMTHPDAAAEFARLPLLALELAAGFHGYLALGHEDARAHLGAIGWLESEDEAILAACAAALVQAKGDEAPLALADMALRIVERFHHRLLDLYRRRGISAMRWDGQRCLPGWSLEHPQAASMTIIRAGESVLVLRRPADDYLYPNCWTIPGGYLEGGESPLMAAAREVVEETGLFIKPEPLFAGQPILSDRLAAFCFEAQIGAPHSLRMTEHDAYRFIRLSDVPSLDLTREARLIFERYLEGSASMRRPVGEFRNAT